jgi:hypothetical protein
VCTRSAAVGSALLRGQRHGIVRYDCNIAETPSGKVTPLSDICAVEYHSLAKWGKTYVNCSGHWQATACLSCGHGDSVTVTVTVTPVKLTLKVDRDGVPVDSLAAAAGNSDSDSEDSDTVTKNYY